MEILTAIFSVYDDLLQTKMWNEAVNEKYPLVVDRETKFDNMKTQKSLLLPTRFSMTHMDKMVGSSPTSSFWETMATFF